MSERQNNINDKNSPYSRDSWEQNGKNVSANTDVASSESQQEWPPTTSRPSFLPDHIDGIFSILFLVLGYLFLRWWVILGSGIRMGVFALLYIIVILSYMACKKRKPTKESWFWLAILLGCAMSYVLWGSERMVGGHWLLQMIFLLGAAVYWVLSASGVLVQGGTGNWMAVDLFRGFVKLPFGNFGCLFQSLFGCLKKLRQGRNLLAFLLGLLLCLPVLGFTLPLLIGADKGFASLIDSMFRELFENLLPIVLYGLFGIPVGCYLFGLVAGGIHKCNTDVNPSIMQKIPVGLRKLPMISVYTLLCVIGIVYVLFMTVQTGNLFSSFAGRCPEGYQSYAEYAREGFFELCKVAAFNGALLLAANCFSKHSSQESGFLRFCNVFLSVLTLLLLITAMNKMVLYVSAYGLSVRRLLPSWFMIFLGLCFVLVIVLQWKHFSVIRGIAILGSIMFVMLCLVDLDGLTASYNLNRYQSGTLSNFSVDFLYDCGLGGVRPAVELYRETEDQQLRTEIQIYLEHMLWQTEYANDEWTTATIQTYQIEHLLEEVLEITIKE